MDNKHLNHSNQSGLAAFKASLFFKIIDWCLINTMVFLCITVDTLAYSHSVRAAELPPNIELTQLIQIGNSTQTGVKRITRNDFDFTYTLNISYIVDTPLQQVKGHLISLSPSTQIIDANIDFGNLMPGQTLTGKDTYTIRQDRTKPFNPSDLKWSFTYNHPPIAEAGSDQSVPVGAEVLLDGTGSTDAEGDSLTYRWTFTARPNDSVAALDNLAAPKSRFIVDRAGRYVVSLIVNDGNQDSTADTVVIDTKNSKPVADAGPDQTVATGDTVYLNGSASRDPDGDQLQYKWTLQEAPADSLTELKFADSATPFFIATKAGRYVVHLIVSDGKLDSEADLVIVSTRNSAPVADAGPDQSITLSDPSITLHGSNSHDVDGQALTYRWAILSAPHGSTAEINPDNTAEPGFKPELPGLYIMQLIVNDGEQDSGPDTLQITVASPPPPPNQAPKITTSPDITGTVGQLYTYDVDATDPDISDILGYSLQVAAPGMLIDSLSGLISWTPTEAGDFEITAKVQDQGGFSDTQNYTLTINAAPPANRAPQITSTPVTTATVGQLYSYDADATDPDGDALTYDLTQSPDGMTIDATTGLIQWTPSGINDQPPAVTIHVTDAGGLPAEQDFTISVVSPNRAPVAVDDVYTVDQDKNLVIASNSDASGITGKAVALANTDQPAQAVSVAKAYGKQPLHFEANQGQTDPQVKFLARGPGYGLFLTPTEAVMTLESINEKTSLAPEQVQQSRSAKNPLPPGEGRERGSKNGLSDLKTANYQPNQRNEIPFGSPSPQPSPTGRGGSVPTAHQPVSQLAVRPEPVEGLPTTLRLKLRNANPNAQIAGIDEQPGKSHYLIGNDPSQWRKNVPNYAKVAYDEVYPGIDLVYYGNQRQLEYDFIVAPNADPKAIQMAIEGAENVSIDPDGNLILSTPNGEIRQHKPIVYQETNGQRRPIEGRYVLLANGDPDAVRRVRTAHQSPAPDGVSTPSATFAVSGNGATQETKGTGYISRLAKAATQIASIGFELADYDHSQPLVIDPVLEYATYLGGNNSDSPRGLAVDKAGNAYISGLTISVDFPFVNGVQPVNAGGGMDAFVAKLSADGTSLLYSTFIGGQGSDYSQGLAVDTEGNAYVFGSTSSNDFPLKNPFQASRAGDYDAFVLKLDQTGAQIIYSSYLGGSSKEEIATGAIALDSSGAAYLTGQTRSPDFPTENALQGYGGGGYWGDAFAAKVLPDGSGLAYSTFLGGNQDEIGYGIAVDSQGSAYVAGWTNSSNFPMANALQAAHGGQAGRTCGSSSCGGDAFLTKLSPDGTSMVYSTFLGGSDDDMAFALAVDVTGNAYITGQTHSTNFPTLNAVQPALSAGFETFVAKLNPSGSALVYSTYLGGTSQNTGQGNSIAADAAGNAYVFGSTDSSDFPTVNPIQAGFGGGQGDGFISKIGPAGGSLKFSTYLGGNGKEIAYRLAVDECGDIYSATDTQSANLPTVAALDSSFNGGSSSYGDAYIAKLLFSEVTDLSLTKTATPDPILTGNQLTYHLTVSNLCAKDATGVKVSDLLPQQFAYTVATPTQGSCNAQNDQLNCELGNIGPKGSADITVTGTVSASTSLNLTNQANVSADQDDPDPRNNTASATALLRTSWGVLGNDSDFDGDALTARRMTTTAHGTLNLNPDGSFTYAPQAGFSGVDTFTYQANDGKLDSNIATVTITVNKINHAPQITSTAVTTATATHAYGYPVTATDPDAGDTLTYSLGDHPTGMSIDKATGLIQWTPTTEQNGTHNVTVTVNDSGGLSQIQTFTVTVILATPPNRAPLAQDEPFTTAGIAFLQAAPGVLGNDSDPDGDMIIALLVSGPANGIVNLNPDGSFTYTPNAGFVGTDSFTYKASDGKLDSVRP